MECVFGIADGAENQAEGAVALEVRKPALAGAGFVEAAPTLDDLIHNQAFTG